MSDPPISYFAGTGIVGGRVFLDSDNDGARDPPVPPPNAANLFNDDDDGIISSFGIFLYPCGSDLPLDSTGASATGAYAFSNLVAGEYYVGVPDPPEGYGFSSEVWGSAYGDSETVLQDMIVEGALLGTTPNGSDVIKAELRGTGGVVNGVIGGIDPVRNTIHPATWKTLCFPLEEGESSMEWGVGLRRADVVRPSMPPDLTSVSSLSPSPTWNATSINVTDTSVSPVPSTSPTLVPRISPDPTADPTIHKSAVDDVSGVPSLIPSGAASNQWPQAVDNSLIGTSNNAAPDNLFEGPPQETPSAAVGTETQGGDGSSSTGTIIGIVIAVFSLIAAGMLAIRRRKRRTKGGDLPDVVEVREVPASKIVITKKDNHGDISGMNDSDRQSSASSVIEAARDAIRASNILARYPSSSAGGNDVGEDCDDGDKSPPLARSMTYPPDPPPVYNYESKHSDNASLAVSLGSNNSGGGTYYSAGGNTFSQPPSMPRTFDRNFSPASSHTAAEAERKSLATLQTEFDSLSSAIRPFPQNSATWQVLHGHLERAREELEAVRQDIEMSPRQQPSEEDKTAGLLPVPVPPVDPRRSAPSQSSQASLPEVWIHCPQKDESSLDNSLITFDEWNMMSDGSRERPDPAGCTKYIEAAAAPQPLMAITENGEESVISGAVVALEEAKKATAEMEDLELVLQKKMDNMMMELSTIRAETDQKKMDNMMNELSTIREETENLKKGAKAKKGESKEFTRMLKPDDASGSNG